VIERILPSGIVTAESLAPALDVSAEAQSAPPQERAAIARAVPKRQAEFLGVRNLARQAMGSLGVPGVGSAAILKGERGAPAWPQGVVGSLTHCDGYRGAAVGHAHAVRSIGIDAEPHDVLPEGVLPAVSLAEERSWLGSSEARSAHVHFDRVLFCAKEATYKAWFPLTRRWLGFEDARIEFDIDPSGTAGTFSSTILIDPAALSGPPLTRLDGRWFVSDGLVLAAITLT
jgi:4'-phosphopantetheinyl transferase EntD